MSETCTCGCGHGSTADAPPSTSWVVGPGATVEDAARQSLRAAEILPELGIDTCCGGRLTLSQAAASAGLSVGAVLDALAAGREDA